MSQKFQAHKMFFSLDCVTADRYIHGVHYMLYKTMLKNSDEAYLLIDQTKLVDRLDIKLCNFFALSGVISDFEFPKATKQAFPAVKFICVKE